jgi:hypothetical protein
MNSRVRTPKLSPGGYLIVDDYLDVPSCRAAVTDYRNKHGIEEKIIEIDFNGVCWKKKSRRDARFRATNRSFPSPPLDSLDP